MYAPGRALEGGTSGHGICRSIVPPDQYPRRYSMTINRVDKSETLADAIAAVVGCGNAHASNFPF
jgi:hypothetical protein